MEGEYIYKVEKGTKHGNFTFLVFSIIISIITSAYVIKALTQVTCARIRSIH